MLTIGTGWMVSRRALVVALLWTGGVFPAAARAGEIPEALRGRVGTEFDERAVDSLDLILSLKLTGEQARAILPRLEEACSLHLRNYHDLAEIRPEEVRAYTAFLEEDRLNQGFSPEVEQRTRRVHFRVVEIQQKLAADLNALADEVRSIVLTPDQQDLAESYKPNKEAVIAALADPHERRKAERRARCRASGPPAEDPPLAEARKAKEAVARATHAHQDVIAQYVLCPAAAEPLYKLAGARRPAVVREAVRCRRSGTEGYPLDQYQQDKEALRKLRREISDWNLVNGMHLSCEQLQKLIYLAAEAERLRIGQRQGRSKDKLPREALDEELVRLELAVEAVLRLGQLEVLSSFQPCLLPPKDLKDPVRVGQVTDSAGTALWLTWPRGKSDRTVERMIDRLIEREATRYGTLDEQALAERRSLLRETVRQVAQMDEVEFAVNKDDLVEAIQPKNRESELAAKIDTLRRDRHLPGSISRLLLHRDIAAVYRIRYQQLSRGTTTGKDNGSKRASGWNSEGAGLSK